MEHPMRGLKRDGAGKNGENAAIFDSGEKLFFAADV